MKSALKNNLISIHKAKLLTNALLVCAFCFSSFALYGATVLNTSVFGLPTSEYTHVIIETNQAVSHSMMILKNPHRVVLDLKNTPINDPLILLTKKDFMEDLSIKQVRVGNFKAGITRIVFDLKTEVKAVLNMDKPKDQYKHRLMLDFFPTQNKPVTIDPQNSTSNTSKEGINRTDSKSTGAKIILEPNYEDEEMLMDEYEQF
jgi:N-acetylmuramoyl-L-alanine amidase